MKERAEMADTAIAHFQGGFSNVALPAAKQFRSAFHSDLSRVLLDRHPDFLREQAAEVERTAGDDSAEFFE